jgi:transcriptional regulator with XRE-family HTH domain
MATLSEQLKRERELRGVSLQQISEETRIGVRFLQALEDDRLEVIPGEFYRRSYLRAYARYLGLDEDRALNVYDFSRREKPASGETESGPGVGLAFPPWLKWAGAAAIIGIPLLLLLRAMPASTGGTDALEPYSGERPVARVKTLPQAPPPARVEISPAPFPVESSPAPEAGLRLLLSVEESCWLEIEADGEVVVSGLKDQGFRKEVRAARELRLWLGNAGGVRVFLNDQEAVPLGRPGQVRKDLTITLDNYRDFVSSQNRS